MTQAKVTIFLLTLLFFIGCSKVTSVEPGSLDDVKITSNGSRYSDGDKVKISVEGLDGIDGAKVSWKEDDGDFVEGEATKEFGPYKDEDGLKHIVTVKVVTSDKDTLEKKFLLKSKTLTPVKVNGRLSVNSQGQIINEKGKAIQLRGMSTHGIQYYPEFYRKKNAIKALAYEWDADIIRISSYVNEGWREGKYTSNPAKWKNHIDTLVDWATEYGIYVLIDWHMLSPGDPNHFLDEAKDFWEYMVTAHGSKENVLFDICNEPNNDGGGWKQDPKTGEWYTTIPGKNVTWDLIKQYADEIIPIIRAKSNNIIIVGTPEWASNPSAVINNKINEENIMYTMHFYAADHGDNYISNMTRAFRAGIPIFVTEFGTQEASGDGKNDFKASEKWLDTLAKYKISWCNWNYSLDHRTGAVFQGPKDDSEFYVDFLDNFVTVEDFIDESQIKEAGLWIMDKIKYPEDDFE